MIKLSIPYGQKSLHFACPEHNYVETISPRSVQTAPDEDDAIAVALDNPIGSPSIEQLAKPDDRVVIVVDDYTRPTPVARVLPHVLRRLHVAGIKPGQISIAFALGTHRAMTAEEIWHKVGVSVAAEHRLINTSVQDGSEYDFFGESRLGIPVYVLKEVSAATLRIGIGGIVPHCDVGYAGGGKILLPGVCSAQTVAANHMKGLDFQGRNFLGASTTVIREDIEDVVSRVGLHFIVNAITALDGRLYKVVAGDYIKAHRAGIPYARDIYGVPVRRRVDIGICSSYPADVDFVQVTKAIWSGDKMTKPGGDLVIVTPCSEGLGPYTMLSRFMKQDHKLLAERIQRGDVPLDIEGVMAALAVRVKRIGERVHISIVSDGLSSAIAREMGFHHFATIEQALAHALAQQGSDATVSVMTHGGYTYPIVTGEREDYGRVATVTPTQAA